MTTKSIQNSIKSFYTTWISHRWWIDEEKNNLQGFKECYYLWLKKFQIEIDDQQRNEINAELERFYCSPIDR